MIGKFLSISNNLYLEFHRIYNIEVVNEIALNINLIDGEFHKITSYIKPNRHLIKVIIESNKIISFP
jgi:hypothetical protein